MTPEKIQERIKGLLGQRDEALALAHSLDGAVQDCEYWLKELEKDGQDKGRTETGSEVNSGDSDNGHSGGLGLSLVHSGREDGASVVGHAGGSEAEGP
jgi:hypothetical protein